MVINKSRFYLLLITGRWIRITLGFEGGFCKFNGFLKAFAIFAIAGLVNNLGATPIIAESNQTSQSNQSNLINTQSSQSSSSTQSMVDLPLELDLINQPEIALERGIITADTVSQEGITHPSLWWVRDQFGRQIVINWLIYSQEKRIDLVVDRRIWNFINYIEKYSLINHFAINSREYGYNLRVFNDQELLLGIATCEPSNQAKTQASNCQARILIPNERGLPATRLRTPIFF